MRLLLLPLLISPLSLMAEGNMLKPGDFQPLTSLPWKAPHATLEGTLDAIYREPDLAIRYPVLANYLWTIPVGQLEKAFDTCVDLECYQCPDEFVYFFLQIWGARDPIACWKRTRALFRIAGLANGWLDYGYWNERITVQDVDAIRSSRFWVAPSALKGFPLGVDQSSLPKKERVQIMRAFADKWFEAFASWPGFPTLTLDSSQNLPTGQYPQSYHLHAPLLIEVFSMPMNQLRLFGTKNQSGDTDEGGPFINPGEESAFIVAERRRLQADPASAPAIFKKIQSYKWGNTSEWQSDMDNDILSFGLLMLWAKLDLVGIIHWADSLDFKNDRVALFARGMLMNRVDAETRSRWLAQAKASKYEDDMTSPLISEWAAWDPAAGLAAAVENTTYNWDIVAFAAQGAAYGPSVRDWPINGCHFGLEAIKNFDVGKVPEKFRGQVKDQWDVILEQWGDIDIGETARYGVDFLNRIGYPPHQRDKVLRYFSGEQVEGEGTGIGERTMCALRVWAVVRPGEMKRWIATLDDPKLRKALTWMLNHPW